MPTLYFLVYLSAIGAAYLVRLAYIGWFGPYLLLCVAAVPPFLFLLSLPSILKLRLSLEAKVYAAKGESAALTLRFSGVRFFPLNRSRIVIEVENRFAGERRRFRYIFRAVETEEVEVPLPTELCGQLVCRVLRWDCGDILGLFSFRKKCPAAVKCTVMPAIVPPESPPDLDAALAREPVLKPKYGGGFAEDHELREYRPGDTVNSIHWKLSSKVDDVIIREALVPENSEVFLLLSQVGVDDRGLEVLYWLSTELCAREIAHYVAGNRLYRVENELQAAAVLAEILSVPIGEPARFDSARARCVLQVSAGEVNVL